MAESAAKGRSGEDFVNRIAFGSFLKYWCFPGPTDLIKDNKEICDLLVLFDDICIIISVKNYEFKGDYERYFRKTVDKAIRQIEGAERKLFREETLLIKHPDRKEEVFEREKYKHIHRVIVNLDSSVKYYQTSHFKDGKIYSVMDAIAWYTALEELDTISDVTRYFSARCNLFREHPAFIFPREEYDISTNDRISAWGEIEQIAVTGKKVTIVNGSELDLIAEFIQNAFKFPSTLTHGELDGMLLNIDGRWSKFLNSKVSAKKDDYEKESYFIDKLVKEFLIHIDQGNHLATMFFRMDRLERAEFAGAFIKYHESYVMDNHHVRLNRTHFVMPFIHMVFLCHDDDYPQEQIDEVIEMSLLHHHYLYKFRCREVGALAMSKTSEKFTFGYSRLDGEYSEEEILELKKGFAAMGWQTKQV